MFDLSLQELKADTCHSHSSTLAEHSHATYHYRKYPLNTVLHISK